MEEKKDDKKRGIKESIKSSQQQKSKIKDSGCYGILDSNSGQNDVSLALKIIKKSGEQIAIWYYEIASPIKLTDNSKIEFSTPNLKISIMGNNLQVLFDAILEHKVVWVKEPESEFNLEKKEALFIQNIMVAE